MSPPKRKPAIPDAIEPPSRERAQQSVAKVIWICFALGSALFIGGIGLVYIWFHDPSFRAPGRGVRAAASSPSPTGIAHAPRRATVPPAASQGEPRSLDLFFSADGVTLTPEVTTLSRDLPPHDLLVFVLQRLLEGPVAQTLVSAIPSGTTLRAAYLMDDIAVVDLEGNLLSRPTGGPTAEILCAYAVVNTVTANLPAIRSVQILVDGRAVPFLWDQLDLSAPLLPDESFIKR